MLSMHPLPLLTLSPNADPNAPNPIPFVSGPNASKYFGHYLGVGEYVYDHTVAYAHKSPYFKQTNPALNLAEGAGHVAEKLREEGMKKGGQWFWGSGGGGAEGKGK